MIKINREFCLTDNSVNCYGYRLLTEGIEIDKYKPPIGFLMHDRDKGVAVSWSDFHVVGDALYATPTINDTLFPDLAKMVEEGFINAASVGGIVALDLSDDPADKLPGQDGPTVKRWYPREISLVDIPGNPNALGQLYDELGNVLKDLTYKPKCIMNLNEIFTELRAGATEAEQRDFLLALRDRNATLEKELTDLRQQFIEKEIKEILARAVSEHRLTQELANCLEKDYVGKIEALRNLIDKMPAKKSVPAPEPKPGTDYTALSWDELDHKNLLARLKAENPDLYQKKFAEKFSKA